jgi:Mlc titration factor MtfA (ptsG expression regulator)
MPHRFILLPLLVITGIYFWISYENEGPNPYILTALVVAAVGVFIFKFQIDDFFYHNFTPRLEEKEKFWLLKHVPYLSSLGQEEREAFFVALSRLSLTHEFIPLNIPTVYEEMKWMVLAPAIRLGLSENAGLMKLYQRTAIYPHPFITPLQDYVHVCEHNREDGILVFSAEQLNASHLQHERYLNPALYEWCLIFREEILHHVKEPDADQTLEICLKVLGKKMEEIINWLGQSKPSFAALTLYACISKPSLMQSEYPALFEQYYVTYSVTSVKHS